MINELLAGAARKPQGLIATLWGRGGAILLLFACGMLGSMAARAETPGGAGTANGDSGPTIWMDYGRSDGPGSAMATFMYFIPLISPEPVRALSSPGSTQKARVMSAQRHQSGNSFTTTCDFEFTGNGSQEDVFDLGRIIQQHEGQLKAGGTLTKQLRSITVSGTGRGRVEVKGVMSNGAPMVNQVRLRFNAQGQSSPVSIGLCDIRYHEGEFRAVKEIEAKVNSLTFRREPGQPRMEVSVGSVKHKGAGNGVLQNLAGSIKGAAANMLIDPLPVEVVGNDAMLDFGQALANGATSFTFPHATHLVVN